MCAKLVEFPLPPAGLRFMGEDDQDLVQIGHGLADLLVENGLTETASVIDVGSGYGRLALGIADALSYRGRYLGFDILPRHVAWCAENLTPMAPNFRFHHLDVRNGRYNPTGLIDPAEVRFPSGSARYDVAAVFSVFTHLDEGAIRHYLAEIRRVLRWNGVAVTTWFMFDQDRLEAVTSPQSRFPMVHELASGVRYAFQDDPLHAISYDQALIREMVATAGLSIASEERGSWAGEPGREPAGRRWCSGAGVSATASATERIGPAGSRAARADGSGGEGAGSCAARGGSGSGPRPADGEAPRAGTTVPMDAISGRSV